MHAVRLFCRAAPLTSSIHASFLCHSPAYMTSISRLGSRALSLYRVPQNLWVYGVHVRMCISILLYHSVRHEDQVVMRHEQNQMMPLATLLRMLISPFQPSSPLLLDRRLHRQTGRVLIAGLVE